MECLWLTQVSLSVSPWAWLREQDLRATVLPVPAYALSIAYSPLKRGSRFSRKAVNPSTMSLLFMVTSST